MLDFTDLIIASRGAHHKAAHPKHSVEHPLWARSYPIAIQLTLNKAGREFWSHQNLINITSVICLFKSITKI